MTDLDRATYVCIADQFYASVAALMADDELDAEEALRRVLYIIIPAGNC